MKFLKLKKAADKEYSIHYWSEKEREADTDPHTYKVSKDKKQAIELAKDLFKKMNYEGLVTVDSGDYSYYSTDNYDWDALNKLNSKDYKKGYRDGNNDYKIGHPMDIDDFDEKYSEEYIDGYWQGFNDAQEKEFMKQSAEEINFEKDLMEAGKSKGKKDKVSEEQLEMGKEVEKEHTTNPEIAEKITRDHLEEIPDYYTHLKKMEDAVKKESAIQQPNKPKPTTVLPDNLEWSWDPNAADWVAVMKNNTNVTPPLYNPQNQNLVNQNTTSYMSNIKSASCLSQFLDGPRYSKEIKIEAGLIKDGLVKYAGFDFNRGTKYAITDKGLEVLRKASEAEHNEALNEREKLAYMFGFNTDEVSTLDTVGKIIKSEEITDEQLEESWNKYYPLYRKDVEEEKMTEENYPADDEVAQKLKTTLSMYLHGLKRYRKAIPIMKYHTNAKMKRAVEDGHSKGLGEDEITKQVDDIAEEYYKKENKIKPTLNSLSEDYLKSFLFGIIKNKKSASLNKFAKKWTICEADGTPLGKVTASSELDAKVKFGIEHPQYADSLSISAKEVCATNKPFESTMGFYTYEVLWQDHDDKDGEFIEPIIFELCDDRDIDEWSWKCEELFGKEWFYGFLSRKDAMDKVIEELNKWGTIKGEIKQVDSLYTGRLKKLHSKYEETTEQHLDYPNPSETPVTDTIVENHTGWVNTAEQKVTPEFAKLHKLLGEYKKQNLIQLSDLDGNLVASGDPQIINELEHQVKEIGYYCESVDEYTDSDYAETYSLKIFMK